MKIDKKHNRSHCSVADNLFCRFSSVLLVLSFALLLLTGCSGLYTSYPVADKNASVIDPRLDGMWQSINERSKWDWTVQFSGEDHVTGKLSLFRSYYSYSSMPGKALLNVFPVRCIRKENKGVCSAELDGTPVPRVKEDMRGWLTLDVDDTWSPGSKARYVVVYYEIKENGTIAVYADANLEVVEKYVADKGFAFNKDQVFVVTEPAPGLTKMLDNVMEFFNPKATAILTKVVQETADAKVTRLIGQLNKGSSKSRYDAALQLGQLGEQAADAAPVLTKVIWDALASEKAVDRAVMRATVQALGSIGVASPDTLAALEALWTLNISEIEAELEQTVQILKQKQQNTPALD